MATKSQLDRIEDKLDELLSYDAQLISAREAMKMLGVKSQSMFWKITKRLKIRFVTKGRYRRLDIANAVAKAALGLNDHGADHSA